MTLSPAMETKLTTPTNGKATTRLPRKSARINKALLSEVNGKQLGGKA